MARVINFPSKNDKNSASVTYKTLKEYAGTPDCQQIVLCYGESHREGIEDSYAVLLMAPPGSYDGFDIIASFQHTEVGLEMANIVADAADRTLSSAYMLQPDDEENWTPEQIDELCAEARTIYGDFAAEQLRSKLEAGRA